MRLFRQIVQRKMQRFLENVANRKNEYWDFLQVYNLVCVIDNVQPNLDRIREVNRAWRNVVIDINVEKSLSVLEHFYNENMPLVTQFLKETESMEQAENRFAGMYEKGRGIIGVASFEFEKS